MATFYGQVQGMRGAASRTGSKSSGLSVSCQSYDGSVVTEMHYNSDNVLMVRVLLSDQSTSGYYAETVFHGTMEELKQVFKDYENKNKGEN